MLSRSMRAGTSLIEASIAVVLAAMVLNGVTVIASGANGSTARSGSESDALRSVVLATESLQRDIAGMAYQIPDRDLAIFDGGHGVSFRIPSAADSRDLWNISYVPVSYALNPVPGSSAKFLIRTDSKGARALPGCYLRDLHVVFTPQGVMSPVQAYLNVIVIGLDSPAGKTALTSSFLVPLALMGLPGAAPAATGEE